MNFLIDFPLAYFKPEFLKGMNYFEKEIKSSESINIIYGGDLSHQINGARLISWKDITK